MAEDLVLFIAQNTENGMWKQFSSSSAAKWALCVPWGVHYRPKNGGLHFKVWKYQGGSFNKKCQEPQDLIVGQEDGDSGIFKQVQKTFLMNDTVQMLLSWGLALVAYPAPSTGVSINMCWRCTQSSKATRSACISSPAWHQLKQCSCKRVRD